MFVAITAEKKQKMLNQYFRIIFLTIYTITIDGSSASPNAEKAGINNDNESKLRIADVLYNNNPSNSSNSNFSVPVYFSIDKFKHSISQIPALSSATAEYSRLDGSNVNSSSPSNISMVNKHWRSGLRVHVGPELTDDNISKLKTTNSSLFTSASTSHITDLVSNLDRRLKNIRNVELGVTSIQEIYDAMEFTTVLRNDTKILYDITQRIEIKLKSANQGLKKLSNFITTQIGSTNANKNETIIFLNTIHDPCPYELYDTGENEPQEDGSALAKNYNKEQIEILTADIFTFASNTKNDKNLNFIINQNINKFIKELNRIPASSDSVEKISTSDFPRYKDIFFLSKSDDASHRLCHNFYYNDLYYRNLYVSSIGRKWVLLLIDNGNALSAEQFELSKKLAFYIIKMLGNEDLITVLTINERVEGIKFKEGHIAENPQLTTMDNKMQLLNFIGNVNRSKSQTNHTEGFRAAFEVIRIQEKSISVAESSNIQFLYLSRGFLSSLTEATDVLSTIAEGQKHLRKPIRIDTCLIIVDEKRIMYEKQFLRDIARQNFSKFGIKGEVESLTSVGEMFVITKQDEYRMIEISTSIFRSIFERADLVEEIEYHTHPVVDVHSGEEIISATLPVPKLGIAGISLDLNDLAEDLIYFRRHSDSYAFMINLKGETIFHPAFPRPHAVKTEPYPVDIGLLENRASDFISLRRRMLNEAQGNATAVTVELNENKTVTYTWKRVSDVFVVCIRTIHQNNGKLPVQLLRAMPATLRHCSHRQQQQPNHNSDLDNLERGSSRHSCSPLIDFPELLYHRIDLISPAHTSMCRHFGHIATLESGTVYLSASSFRSPFTYIRNNIRVTPHVKNEQAMLNAQSVMAYIKDMTNLLANPGLQPQVRNDVMALLHVLAYLKKRHQEAGPFKKFVIRRYAATTNGVLVIFPGCIIPQQESFEPQLRPWFRKAMEHSGKITITSPYLDAGGAGYIVTISHTIFEGKSNALHSAERDQPVIIVAMDFSYGFFYRNILDSTAFCSDSNIKCMIIDDNGYLIAHESFLQPSLDRHNNRLSQKHITHKESFVANDILNHKALVQKKACARYENRTIQRYYVYNTSLSEILTNVVHGERTKYHITSIPGTNLFVIVLNSTFDGGAFCPCNTLNRVCLNCNRMDQTDCECPCECPLSITSNNITILDYCLPPDEDKFMYNDLDVSQQNQQRMLKPCQPINCDLYTLQTDCLGVIGCEWCQLDVDGNIFSAPFCTTQTACFNGVLGSITPYGDIGELSASIVETAIPPAYSAMAIGPVGGAIIALCFVVGFAMYCYRQNIDIGSEQLCIESLQEENFGVPMSRFNFGDVSPHDDGANNGANNRLFNARSLHPIANEIALPSDVSPYHMGVGAYRPPPVPNNVESDHGYSTMTPHEDSEHMCFAVVEPLLNRKRISMSMDSMSINTSVSSPTNHYRPQEVNAIDRPPPDCSDRFDNDDEKLRTVVQHSEPIYSTQTFSSPHHILAPVTVHRHMEAL